MPNPTSVTPDGAADATGAVATAFYRDTLGLRFLFCRRTDAVLFRLRRRASDAEYGGGRSQRHVGAHFITDIEGSAKSLAARGVVFIEEPHFLVRMPDHDLWLAEFRDSEGNVCALMEEKR